MLASLRRELKSLADPARARVLQRFFKTGKGEYGEGDIFLGITVPASRKIAINYKDLPFRYIRELLKSKIHEERLIALLILVRNFVKGDDEKKKEIFDFYLKSTKYINNWDLVDLSAGYIVGDYLYSRRPNDILEKLARSENLWERRIAIISTFAFIYKKDPSLTLKIAELLTSDRNDLIQKAVGWMLREVGKRCGRDVEEAFLVSHYKNMGRTALRYAIEHFPQEKRLAYLRGTV